jgi:hypothetical protein
MRPFAEHPCWEQFAVEKRQRQMIRLAKKLTGREIAIIPLTHFTSEGSL